MARSTETFNKKENEKKKAKKLQDKREKAEERKANSSKGKSLEDMMAYVDEYGNITSTPPDPNKKSKIKSEDIQISVARQEHIEEERQRKGVITHFNESKGYGFIKDSVSQDSIFVHVNASKDLLREGDKVEFETEQGQKGLNAILVKVIK